jgi:hypothetical protein
MRRNPHIAAILVLIFVSLILTGCDGMTVTPAAQQEGIMLATPVLLTGACEACDQATLAAALTQQKISADNQTASTAEIARVNAQATFNSANATLNAAQVQAQNNANFLAAQVAATAEVARANAQATVNSAGSTQAAAMTQSQYNLQVTQAIGTQSAQAVIIQQNKNDLVAGTQTSIANNIATQTQVAAATSQWYTDQERQREEQRQRQGPLGYLWIWCPPIFIVLLAGLVLWGFWRWLKIQQNNQRILESPVEQLPVPMAEVRRHRHDDELPYLDVDVVDTRYRLTEPDDQESDDQESDDQVDQWVDDVKSQLLKSEKEKDDNTDD